MTELDLLRQVEKLCRRHDVQLFHSYQPERDRPGFPDCTLLGTRAAAFRELKSRTGRLRPEQLQTINRMRACGLNAGLWRPADLESGRVELELAALSGRKPWEPMPR